MQGAGTQAGSRATSAGGASIFSYNHKRLMYFMRMCCIECVCVCVFVCERRGQGTKPAHGPPQQGAPLPPPTAASPATTPSPASPATVGQGRGCCRAVVVLEVVV